MTREDADKLQEWGRRAALEEQPTKQQRIAAEMVRLGGIDRRVGAITVPGGRVDAILRRLTGEHITQATALRLIKQHLQGGD